MVGIQGGQGAGVDLPSAESCRGVPVPGRPRELKGGGRAFDQLLCQESSILARHKGEVLWIVLDPGYLQPHQANCSTLIAATPGPVVAKPLKGDTPPQRYAPTLETAMLERAERKRKAAIAMKPSVVKEEVNSSSEEKQRKKKKNYCLLTRKVQQK
ncbi:hypothetical protein ACLOJK_035438 [Asimina triloba]